MNMDNLSNEDLRKILSVDIERLRDAAAGLRDASNHVSRQLDNGGVTEGAHMAMAHAINQVMRALALSHKIESRIKGRGE